MACFKDSIRRQSVHFFSQAQIGPFFHFGDKRYMRTCLILQNEANFNQYKCIYIPVESINFPNSKASSKDRQSTLHHSLVSLLDMTVDSVCGWLVWGGERMVVENGKKRMAFTFVVTGHWKQKVSIIEEIYCSQGDCSRRNLVGRAFE